MSRSQESDRTRKSISASMRFRVLKRYSFRCRYCSASDVPLEIDHAISLANGGDHAEHNFVPACRNCNAGKGAISVEPPGVISKTKHDYADNIVSILHGKPVRRSRYRWTVQRLLRRIDPDKLTTWAIEAAELHESTPQRFLALTEVAYPEYYSASHG